MQTLGQSRCMPAGVVHIPRSFHPNRRELVAPVMLDPTGRRGPTPGQARGPRWRRSSHGFYVPAWVDSGQVDQRILEAGAALPGYGGVTGWAALRWLGGSWFTGTRADGSTLPVTLATLDIRPQPGIVPSEERMKASEVIVHDGLRITDALRSTLFEMRYAGSLWSAVVTADMAAFSDLVSLDQLWPYAVAHSGMTGIPQARDAIWLADENTWSPMETIMRLIWMLIAELPRPLMNQPVFDLQGQHVGTPDLLDIEAGLYGEYDSAFHLEGRRRRKDMVREDAFRRVGLEPVVMIAGQSRDEVAARMVAARERALRLAQPRSWTIQQPSWWIPTQTVAQRRALSPADRLRLLRHRAA
jgi:hypothetical protein